MLRTVALIELAIAWVVWWYPFLFQAPHVQKRPSITVAGPTRIGLLLEVAAFAIAFAFPAPVQSIVRLASGMLLTVVAVLLAFTSVRHLGRMFRVHAGLYHDHELVRTGPYGVVRHPIYASLFAMLLATALVWTSPVWIVVAVAIYIAGTEIRVRCEDGLLAGRFGEQFENYRRRVPGYIPFVR